MYLKQGQDKGWAQRASALDTDCIVGMGQVPSTIRLTGVMTAASLLLSAQRWKQRGGESREKVRAVLSFRLLLISSHIMKGWGRNLAFALGLDLVPALHAAPCIVKGPTSALKRSKWSELNVADVIGQMLGWIFNLEVLIKGSLEVWVMHDGPYKTDIYRTMFRKVTLERWKN